jgi:hypothetical protein
MWPATYGLSYDFLATRRHLAEAASREWPLSGRHLTKLYFSFWPGAVLSARTAVTMELQNDGYRLLRADVLLSGTGSDGSVGCIRISIRSPPRLQKKNP